MRLELPGYDVNYRYGRDHNTPADKKIAELNRFLMENGIRGGIACLDEKGKVVQRYTDRVVLEIDDSTPSEKLERVKRMVSELLRIMGTTDSQIADLLDNNADKVNNVEGVNNMGEYEREKFGKMKKKLKSLIETMDIIGEYVNKADKLGIYVDKNFTFDEIYRSGGFDGTPGHVDFNDLRKKFEGYNENLQKAIREGKDIYNLINMTDYEREKFLSMKSCFEALVETMDIIGEYVNKADKLGIYVDKNFTFDEIYRSGGFDGTSGQVDFNDLRKMFEGYSYKLQTRVLSKSR